MATTFFSAPQSSTPTRSSFEYTLNFGVEKASCTTAATVGSSPSSAAVQRLRTQKTLSLNLERRKAERAAQDSERLTRENTRRAARGQPKIDDLSKLDGQDAPDALLDEGLRIIADSFAAVR